MGLLVLRMVRLINTKEKDSVTLSVALSSFLERPPSMLSFDSPKRHIIVSLVELSNQRDCWEMFSVNS